MPVLNKDATPAIPSELAGPLPRNIRLSDSGRETLILALVFFLVAATLAIFYGRIAVNEMQARAALRTNGAVTEGEITLLSSPGRSNRLLVHYTISVNGASFTSKARVPRHLEDSLHQHGFLSVRYLPSNPNISHPAPWEWTFLDNLDMLSGPVIFSGFGLLVVLATRRDRRILTEGTPVLATVTRCSPSRKRGFSAQYEFHLADGLAYVREFSSATNREIGSTLWVLYLPGNPRRSLAYPAANYRIDSRSVL
jgi:hypothetical protein